MDPWPCSPVDARRRYQRASAVTALHGGVKRHRVELNASCRLGSDCGGHCGQREPDFGGSRLTLCPQMMGMDETRISGDDSVCALGLPASHEVRGKPKRAKNSGCR